MSADLIEALANLGAFVVAAISAIGAALWSVVQFLDERRKAREQAEQLERQRLEQQRIDEEGRRAERVAELISKFGETTEPEIRVWTTLALSLYPKETTRLLTMSLGQFSDDVIGGVQLALVGIGPTALPELVSLNRIAQLAADEDEPASVSPAAPVYDVGKLRARTKSVIQQILLRMNQAELAEIDLSDVDLSECGFQGADLRGVSFRKCTLRKVVFRRANLRRAQFRGADLDGTVFSQAALNEADFTGARGQVVAIKAFPEQALFRHANLSQSNFDGASLRGATLLKARFDGASLQGAQLHDCEIRRSSFHGFCARKLKGARIDAQGSKFATADLREAVIPGSRFERCVFVGMNGAALKASQAEFINCNLGGADLSGADLSHVRFKGCQLGGVDLRGATLAGTEFAKCDLKSIKLDQGVALRATP